MDTVRVLAVATTADIKLVRPKIQGDEKIEVFNWCQPVKYGSQQSDSDCMSAAMSRPHNRRWKACWPLSSSWPPGIQWYSPSIAQMNGPSTTAARRSWCRNSEVFNQILCPVAPASAQG